MSNSIQEIPKIPEDPKALRQFLERAAKGDKSTLPAIRNTLQNRPDLVDLFGGDLVDQVEEKIIKRLAGEDLVIREAISRKLSLLRKELSGSNPSPLEKLLIDRIVVCWVRLYEAEFQDASATSVSIAIAKYRQGRIESLNKQYLAAIKTLATVRKLAIPILIGQVNISEKQVNQSVVQT